MEEQHYQLLDGKAVSAQMKKEMAEEVAQIKAAGGKIPHLAAILVGHDGGSETYVASKVKTCQEIGFKSTLIRFEEDVTEEELLRKVDELNNDPDVDGFIVQLPLPKHISEQKVIEAIDKRHQAGKGFTILAVAEGAISKEDAALSKKEWKKKRENSPYPSVSYEIAKLIGDRTGSEARVTVPGHTQRGGSPCPYDRVLCTRLGSAAAQAILEKDYGYMIAMIDGQTKRVPLEDVAGKLKMVDPDCQMIQEAKRIGISFGD